MTCIVRQNTSIEVNLSFGPFFRFDYPLTIEFLSGNLKGHDYFVHSQSSFIAPMWNHVGPFYDRFMKALILIKRNEMEL